MKEHNTLGQRIQEGRKQAGLSQEALGERLGVSRQAVSKWEADAAVPELENLIAMSRVFGVSMGVLLGVEEPASEPEGLTDRELAAVEAIAAKYLAEAREHQGPGEARRHRQPRRHWAVPAAVGILAVLTLTAGAGLVRQMENIDRQFDQLQAQVNGIQSSVGAQIGSLTDQMSNILDEKNDIFSEYAVSVTAFDLKQETVTLRVSIRPKERRTGTTAVFTAALSDGRQVTAETVQENGGYAVRDWVVPMDGRIALSAALTDAETVRTAPVETLFDCAPEDFQLTVDGEWSCSWSGLQKDTVRLNSVEVRVAPAVNPAADLFPTAVDLCLYRNRETRPEQTLPVEDAQALWQEAGEISIQIYDNYFAPEKTAYTLAPGDVMVGVLRVRDSRGEMSYRVLHAKTMDEDGEIQDVEDRRRTNGDGTETRVYSAEERAGWFAGWRPGMDIRNLLPDA